MGFDFYLIAFTVLPMHLQLTVQNNIPFVGNFIHSLVD